MKALVWVGNMDRKNCTTPDFTEVQFEAMVDALAGDPKVFGYYVADEPHPMACPNAPADLKSGRPELARVRERVAARASSARAAYAAGTAAGSSNTA